MSEGENLSSTSAEPEFVAQKFFEIPASGHHFGSYKWATFFLFFWNLLLRHNLKMRIELVK